uniref:Uncharacterized protein n=1 Tax=Avena sativa TaxID=4498 RepID=A0ACD5TAE6_AVESA
MDTPRAPKFIDIISQFGDNGRIEPDTCDALLRQFQQPNPNGSLMDWRHFLEADFSMRVVAGEDYISSRSIQHQWVGKHIKNDISKCMLFMTMVRVQDMWTSIAWDMKRRQLTIHAAGNRNGVWDAHDNIVHMLKTAFRRCIEVFFEGWVVDWENWAIVYTTASTLSDTKPYGYDYGPEALQFCRTFDGVKQGGRLTSPSTECASSDELLFDLLHLNANTGSLPPEFIQDIDD